MENILYASGAGIVIYGIICSRPNIAYAISIVNYFIKNLGRVL